MATFSGFEAAQSSAAAAPRLMLIEDEESVAVTLTAVLEAAGYGVQTCATVDQALPMIQQGACDVLITDLQVQTAADGLQAIAAAKEADPDVVAILLTGFVSTQSAIEAVRVGAWAYLTKPCNLDELRVTITKGLEHRQQLQELRSQAAAAEAARDWLKLVIEAMPHGVAIADACGRVQACNAATFRNWGGCLDGEGRPQLNYGRPDGGEYDRRQLPLSRALAGETVYSQELEVLNRDSGEVKRLLVSAAPLLAPDGTLLGAVSVCQDIARRHVFPG